MKTKQLNRTDLSELVFIDDDKFELWRSSLSADKAFIKKLYADSLSCATFAFSSTSAENIQAIGISAENISAATGNIQRLNANELNVTSVDGAVSSQTHIGLNDVYLYSGSDISGGDGLPEAYGFFSAATTSSDVWLSMSKLALDGKQQKLSVQTTGFSILNEQLTVDNQVEESSYVELAFPDDLSGRHTLATRHDISSVLSGYIEKNDGNLDLNNISCRNILVSAETEADTERIRHHSEIAVKTPRSNAYVASIYTEQEDGSRESDSRFLASNDGGIGGYDVFYFATGRFVGESQDPEKAGISVDTGYGYALAQTKDVQLGPDEEHLNTEKRTRIDLIGSGNPSITASENIIKNRETTVSDRRLKIEIPLSDREGDQVMALRSDLDEYSYSKDELDQKLQAKAGLSDIHATIFDFGGGDLSAFGWTGRITTGNLTNIGLKQNDPSKWEKQPKFVKIGNQVSAIGDEAFTMCSSLQQIDFANIEYIGKNAFNECSGLVNISIPNTVDLIQDNAFYGCTGLKNVKISNGVKEINQLAFANCIGLQNITLPPSISVVQQDAFKDTGLTCVKAEGRTQDSAEHLLEDAALPDGCRIETWEFQPAGEYVQQSSLTGFATDDDGRNYGINLSSDGEAYVHVPWEQKDPPNTYKTYDDTVTALTSESGFKTYSQTSAQLSNDGYATQSWVQEQGFAGGGISLSDVQATIFDFGGGDLSSFGWTGELSQQDLIDAGIKDNTGAVVKNPVVVRIGNGMTSIGSSAFSGCRGLASVTIPNSVTSIGSYAFCNCSELKGVTIGNSVTSIGSYAFASIGLIEIKVEGKTQAEAKALLAGTEYPETCEIKTWNFQPKGDYVQLSSLSGFTTDDGAKNYKIDISSDGAAYVHVPWSGSSEIPDSYRTYDNTLSSLSDDGYATQAWIENQNFQDKLSDQQISAIDSVVDERQTIIKYRDGSISSYDIIGTIDIDNYLSDNTKYVTDIKIGNAISSIEASLMIGEGILSNVIIPDSVVNIGKNAFGAKWGLSSINIPNSVTSIGDGAFYNAGIVSILIPDGVEMISGHIFTACDNLTNIIFPNGLKTITDGMFWGCTNLSSITIPDSVENIEQYAFKGCTNLQSITIPNSVKKIDNFAFANCTNLLSVIIPSSVEHIDYYAFENCNNISIIFKDYYDKPLPSYFPWRATNVVSSTWNTASQEWVNENFSRIEVVNTLPASPDPTKFYFVTT